MTALRVDIVVVQNLPWRWNTQGRVFLVGGLGFMFDAWDVTLNGVMIPLLSREWDLEPGQAAWIGTANLIGMALGAFVWGTIADRIGRRKPFLAVFTVACIVGTAVIGLVDIGLGLVAFAVANFAYQAALIYYDAMLPDVARPIARGRLSGIGVALGYCGTLLVGVLLTPSPTSPR